MNNSLSAAANPVTVYFDGDCPVCSREIRWYRRCRGAESISWVNIHGDSFAPTGDLDRDAALGELHVRRSDGTIATGVNAFVELWRQLPGWRWLARLAARRGVNRTLNRGYEIFLRRRDRAGNQHAEFAALPRAVQRDLRANHAGELGAVWIYRGILTASRDAQLRRFAKRHLETEKTHLALMRGRVPWRRRSVCSPVWSLAGYLTGLVPAMAGNRAVYATVAAVESFVDEHYRRQLEALRCLRDFDDLRALLARCHADEITHRDEARSRSGEQAGTLVRAWTNMVTNTSRVAVRVARSV